MTLPRPEVGSATILIAAPPDEVYDLIADVTRIGEWSPECVRAEWVGGSTEAVPGARFHGWNEAGTFQWDVPCVVVEAERGRVFSFRAPVDLDTATTWTYAFEAADGCLWADQGRVWRVLAVWQECQGGYEVGETPGARAPA